MPDDREDPPTLYTIGHSNYEFPKFLDLLRRHEIGAVADVRSSPYSRYSPQFNREPLEAALREARIDYVFLGKELGARRSEPDCFVDDRVRYDLVADSGLFQSGLERLRRGMAKYRVAIMCAEKDPLHCHRTILICRRMASAVAIRHILEDGSLESNEEAESRLLALLKLPPSDLFHSRAEMIEQAYEIQGEKIAYVAADPERDTAED